MRVRRGMMAKKPRGGVSYSLVPPRLDAGLSKWTPSVVLSNLALTQKAVLNLNAYAPARENRYINNLLQSERPIGTPPANSGQANYFATLTNDWYPKPGTGSATLVVYFASDPSAPTDFVVKWRGDAAVSFLSFPAGTTPTGSARNSPYYRGQTNISWNAAINNVVTTNGRMKWTMPTTQAGGTGGVAFASVMTITAGSSGSTQVSDVVVCRADEENLYDGDAQHPQGQNIRPQWISAITSLNPAALRFMDSQMTNISMMSNWSDRLPVTNLSYFSTRLDSNHVVAATSPLSTGWIVGPSTATGVDTYTAGAYSAMPVTITHGEWFQGFIQASSVSSTVKVNSGGRGAKPILGIPAVKQTTVSGLTPYTFVYDKYSDGWIISVLGLVVGNPIESLVELCNATNVPGWFCIPFGATVAGDPGVAAGQDFVTLLAQYLISNYALDTVYVEFANEVWNGGFLNTSRAGLAGAAELPGSNSDFDPNRPEQWRKSWDGYYGLRMRQIAQVMRPILGSKLKMILAWGGGAHNPTDLTTQRFQNPNYPQISGATNAPYLQMDIASYASYFAGATFGYDASPIGNNQWLPGGAQGAVDVNGAKTAVDNYINGLATNNQALMDTGLNWIRDDMYANQRYNNGYRANYNNGVVVTTGRMWVWDNFIQSYNKPIMMYEGNHEISGPGASYCVGNAPWNLISGMTFQSNPFSVISSVVTTSTSAALPTGVGANDKIVVWVQPNSNLDIFVEVGSSTVVATTSSRRIPAGTGATRGWATFQVPAGGTHFAAISTGSAGRIYAIKVVAGVPDNVVKNWVFANATDPTGNSALALNPLAGAGSQLYPIYYGAAKLEIINAGAANVFVKLGDINATATASDQALQPNQWVVLDVGSNSFVAILGTSATQQCYVSGGSGSIVGGTTGFNRYGGSKGQIEQTWRAFLSSPQGLQFFQDYLKLFYSFASSKSFCIYSMCMADPWLTHPPIDSLGTRDTGYGSLANQPYVNWTANQNWNNGTFR